MYYVVNLRFFSRKSSLIESCIGYVHLAEYCQSRTSVRRNDVGYIGWAGYMNIFLQLITYNVKLIGAVLVLTAWIAVGISMQCVG